MLSGVRTAAQGLACVEPACPVIQSRLCRKSRCLTALVWSLRDAQCAVALGACLLATHTLAGASPLLAIKHALQPPHRRSRCQAASMLAAPPGCHMQSEASSSHSLLESAGSWSPSFVPIPAPSGLAAQIQRPAHSHADNVQATPLPNIPLYYAGYKVYSASRAGAGATALEAMWQQRDTAVLQKLREQLLAMQSQGVVFPHKSWPARLLTPERRWVPAVYQCIYVICIMLPRAMFRCLSQQLCSGAGTSACKQNLQMSAWDLLHSSMHVSCLTRQHSLADADFWPVFDPSSRLLPPCHLWSFLQYSLPQRSLAVHQQAQSLQGCDPLRCDRYKAVLDNIEGRMRHYYRGEAPEHRIPRMLPSRQLEQLLAPAQR